MLRQVPVGQVNADVPHDQIRQNSKNQADNGNKDYRQKSEIKVTLIV